MKRIICFLLGHRWTSPSLRNEKPLAPSGQDIIDYLTLSCSRCNKHSDLNKTLNNFISKEETEIKRIAVWFKITKNQN
jgi:hypothetical protein